MAVASAIIQISITILMSGMEVATADNCWRGKGPSDFSCSIHPFSSFLLFLLQLNTSPDSVLLPFKLSTVNAVVWSLNLIKSD